MALCIDENNVDRQLLDRHSILGLAGENCLPVAKLWAPTIDLIQNKAPVLGYWPEKDEKAAGRPPQLLFMRDLEMAPLEPIRSQKRNQMLETNQTDRYRGVGLER